MQGITEPKKQVVGFKNLTCENADFIYKKLLEQYADQVGVRVVFEEKKKGNENEIKTKQSYN